MTQNPIHLAPVGEDDHNQRLDLYLANKCVDLSRTRLKALIEAGAVKRNGMIVIQAKMAVKSGDALQLTLPPQEPADPIAQKIDLNIVFEDEYLLVLDKPAGLVVHPAAGHYEGTLVNALLAHCGESLSGINGVKRPGIVHRLDKDTSGLMVIAKTDQAHQGLSRQFEQRTIIRAYHALIWGYLTPSAGEITGNIGRHPINRKKMAVLKQGGRHAVTGYQTLQTYHNGIISWVECRLKTGRTHQIRVHLSTKGHPLIGDPVYGSSRRPVNIDDEVLQFNRQALHAYQLGFIHPIHEKPLLFLSNTPNDIKKLIKILINF